MKGLEKKECVRWKAWMRLLSMWLVVGSSIYMLFDMCRKRCYE